MKKHMDPTAGLVEVTFLDQVRYFQYGFNARAAVEHVTGRNLLASDGWKKFDVTLLRALFWGGLQHKNSGGEPPTIEEVGEWLDEPGVMELVIPAIEKALDLAKLKRVGGEPDPQTPSPQKSSSGTSSGRRRASTSA